MPSVVTYYVAVVVTCLVVLVAGQTVLEQAVSTEGFEQQLCYPLNDPYRT